jgi:hypothetical protein
VGNLKIYQKNNLIKIIAFDAVGIETGYMSQDEGAGVRVPVGARIFNSPCHPDRFWGPNSHLSSGYQKFFLRS